MSGDSDGTVTSLLDAIRLGDDEAKNRLFELVYQKLRHMAAGLMRHERPDHTLQPTGLVHEAVIRLFDGEALGKAPTRNYFFAAAARAMRQILVEHARARASVRRGHGWQRVPLDEELKYFEEQNVDVLALHEALDELAKLQERQSQVVELRYFGRFTVPDIAEQLGVSVATVESDLRKARAFLHMRLAVD
ncbi:MAG: sigma-70 family RNA polymerase sigma factor [Planctomycetes bacterium]|nr:sigma-70 family RNA polymerase sigma factor [Planctomycetota bacterium]